MLKHRSKRLCNIGFGRFGGIRANDSNDDIVNQIFYTVSFRDFQFSKCVCNREANFSLKGKSLLFNFFTRHSDRYYGKMKYNSKHNFVVISKNKKPELSGNENEGIMFYNVEKTHFQLKKKFKTGEILANILVSYGRKNDISLVINIRSHKLNLVANVNKEQFKSSGSISFIDNRSFPWFILYKPLANTIVLQRPDFCEDIVAMALIICCFTVFG